MVILRSQNKITDFLIILAWASPFNYLRYIVTCITSSAGHGSSILLCHGGQASGGGDSRVHNISFTVLHEVVVEFSC